MIQPVKKRRSMSRSRNYNLNNNNDIDSSGHKDPTGLGKDDISVGLNMYSGDELKWNDHPTKYRTLAARTKAYRAMSQDPTVTGSLLMYTQLCRMSDWGVQQALPTKFTTNEEGTSRTPVDWDAAEAERYKVFLEENIKDMEGSMGDLVAQAFDKLVHGFNVTVPVYKYRMGPDQENPKLRSKYDDKAVGWQYFKPIDPYSVYEWDTPRGEGYYGLKGILQQTISGYEKYVPRNRFMLFRSNPKNDSPTGESLLRGVIEPWEQKNKASDIELVGLERNLEGIMVIDTPSAYMSAGATQDQKNVVQYLKKVGTQTKLNNQTYILRPSDRDDNGNRLIDFELMSNSGTTRPEAARTIIEAKERLIAEAMLSQFLKLGSSSGSFALSDDMSNTFIMALKGYVDHIKEVFNREAVCELFRLNKTMFPDTKYVPHMEYSGLEKESVGDFVEALIKAVEKGVVQPTKEIQKEVLDRMDLPSFEAGVAFDKNTAITEKLQDMALNPPEPPAPSGGVSGKGNEVSNITG